MIKLHLFCFLLLCFFFSLFFFFWGGGKRFISCNSSRKPNKMKRQVGKNLFKPILFLYLVCFHMRMYRLHFKKTWNCTLFPSEYKNIFSAIKRLCNRITIFSCNVNEFGITVVLRNEAIGKWTFSRWFLDIFPRIC